jgi:hypothetical protein
VSANKTDNDVSLNEKLMVDDDDSDESDMEVTSCDDLTEVTPFHSFKNLSPEPDILI